MINKINNHRPVVMIRSLAVVTVSLQLLIDFQLCVPVLSNSFNCSLNISGSSKYGDDLTFTEASVECIPGPNTAATEKLAVLLHESLRPHLTSFTGGSSCQERPARRLFACDANGLKPSCRG